MNEMMNFSLALEVLKSGQKVAREGWNGSGMWVSFGEGSPALPAESFWNKHAAAHAYDNGGTAHVLPYLIMKVASGAILMGWAPTQSDLLANDWKIVA